MAHDMWRDIGEGRVQNERTKEIMLLKDLRPKPRTAVRFVELDERRWQKLVKLAERRSSLGKENYTPQQCVEGFIDNAVLESGWQHPMKASSR